MTVEGQRLQGIQFVFCGCMSVFALRILVSPGISEYKVETPQGSQVFVSVCAFTVMHQCEFL